VNFARKARRERSLIVDMTPMIDIVFQLLIFFLTTARLADMSRIAVDLPLERGEQRAVAEAAGLIVNLPADGTIVVSGNVVTLDELEAIARRTAARPGADKLQPLIRADRTLESEQLNEVLRRLARAGFLAARLGTSPP